MERRIVTAALSPRGTVTRRLTQWDYGQTLTFTGADLPESYEVYFSNSKSLGSAKKQIGGADGVQIPDEYLTTGDDVFAWVFLHDGASDGETVYPIVIPVTRRPKPSEETPTPVQQDVITQAIAALNGGVERAEEAADRAEEAADRAEAAAAAIPIIDATLSVAGQAADAKAAGDALNDASAERAELRSEILQAASAVTPLVLTADAIDDNPGTLLMPDGSTAATASAIGASNAYACKTGQTLAYTLSTQPGRLVLAVYDAAGNLTHGVEGNGFSAYITGEYTFAADDAYFRVGGVTGGNYRKNYALSYSYWLPNAATRADIEAIGDALQEALQVSDALDASGLSWNNLPDKYYSGEVYTNNGITFTKRADNSVHSVGTATDQARYYWLYKYSMTPGTYTLGGIPDGAGMQSFALQYAITEGTPGAADYQLILTDTEITVPQGHFLSIRSWYKKGYVDEGHDWNVFLGKNIGEMDSKANPKNFVPVIYENQKAVQELRGYALPTYWETYLQEKAVDIRNAVYSVGNHGVVFQFFTDFHRPQSDVNYRGYTTLPQVLAYIKKHCFVEDVIFGGDVLQKNATAEEAAAVLEQYAQEFAELKPLNIVGNHDDNQYGGDPAGSALVDTGTLYSILFRGMEERVNLEPGMYWYLDNETQKVRVIALNTGIDTVGEWNADTAQHRWLVDTLAGTPEGYTLIVIPHVFFQLSGGALALSAIGSSVKAIVDAYASRSSGTWQGVSYDFTHAGGTVACILCGHAHNDGVIVSEAGYPMIGTVCEAMWGSQQTIARGTQAKETTNEHAFDVVCLDTSSKTIKCVRVGSGADRTFSYPADPAPVPEQETVEVTIPDSGNVFTTIEAGRIYHFTGNLISLELELGPLTGGELRQYHFDFMVGDTPPDLTFTEGLIPTAVIMPDGFELEANKRYEIDILNGYGVVQEWTE